MPGLELRRPEDSIIAVSDEEALIAFEEGVKEGLGQFKAGQVRYFDDEEDFFNELGA